MQNAPGPGNEMQATFVQLVETYQKPLLNLCRMYLCDNAQAEDAVQEAFIKAYRALPSFRGECSHKTWLSRIAINVCRDMRRSAWFTRMNHFITPDDLPEAAAEEDSQSAELADAIQRLPARMKEVILLYYYQNLTMPEIAGALGITSSTVSRRLKTACAKLRDALGEEAVIHG